jgi:hypothetical protein
VNRWAGHNKRVVSQTAETAYSVICNYDIWI